MPSPTGPRARGHGGSSTSCQGACVSLSLSLYMMFTYGFTGPVMVSWCLWRQRAADSAPAAVRGYVGYAMPRCE